MVRVDGTLGDIQLAGGTLLGTGTVATINATVGALKTGVVAPGNGGGGILTTTGSVLFAPTSTFQANINGTTVGTEYNRLRAGNTVTLNNANLSVSLGFTPSVGQQFTIISLSLGSVSGQFAQGTSIVVNGQIFTITYNSQSVVLTAQGSTLTWDGGGANNNWSTAANWNPDVAPLDGVDLVFPAGVPADSFTQNNDISGLDLRSLTMSGDGYNIFGNAITLSNGITANQPSGPFSELGLPITLSQAQTFTNIGGPTFLLSGTLNLNGFGLTVDGASPLTLAGNISGSGGITKNSTGKLVLTGNNSYAGPTTITNGDLRVGATTALGAIGAGNDTVIANGATMELVINVSNIPEAISISGNGLGSTGALLTSGSCSAGCSISGPITLVGDSKVSVSSGDTVTLSGVIFDTALLLGITKIGAGTLVLGGSNTYSGTTTVNAGTLLVNGDTHFSSVNLTAIHGNGECP